MLRIDLQRVAGMSWHGGCVRESVAASESPELQISLRSALLALIVCAMVVGLLMTGRLLVLAVLAGSAALVRAFTAPCRRVAAEDVAAAIVSAVTLPIVALGTLLTVDTFGLHRGELSWVLYFACPAAGAVAGIVMVLLCAVTQFGRPLACYVASFMIVVGAIGWVR